MTASEISSAINNLKGISLEKLDAVKLLNRVDTKFAFKANFLADILNQLIESYFILEIEGTREFHYKTLYFDTPQLKYYHEHHRGKLNRIKVRHRTYVESKLGYFEIKFKNNKGRTIKKRLLNNDVSFKNNEVAAFFQNVVNINPINLKPQIWINYTRLTLVNTAFNERITIDLNLVFSTNKEVFAPFESLVIAEVKQDKKTLSSDFLSLMKKYRIKEGAISKYCLGLATINNTIKKNNFKQKIQSLNKLVNVS
jgi:hypothetical protein